MSLTEFSLALAKEFTESTEPFPIDFDKAWRWLGYSTKASAKRQLSRFKEGIDFSTQLCKNPRRGRSSESIRLSVDCFKMLAMLAETDKGDEVRLYFVECEKRLKQLVQQHFPHLKEQPSPWEKLYDQKFCRTVYSWMGASFYWIFLYQFLTEAERQYLDAVNPVVNGKRKERIHQYLSKETRDRVEPEVVRLAVLVESSTGFQDFHSRYNRLFGFHQSELPLG